MIFFLFVAFYLPLQLYLFFQARSYLRTTALGERGRRLLCGLIAVFFLVIQLPLVWRAMLDVYAYQPYSWLARALFNASSIWGFGAVGSALILFAYNFFHRIILFYSARTGVPPDPGRRRFLRQGVAVAATAPFLVSGYGVLLGRRDFEVEHFEIPISGLSPALSGLSLVHLTDVHVGPFMPAEELAEYVAAANRLGADLIALTGDFVSSSEAEVAPCVDTLAGLKARYGVFATMGNHDIYAHVDRALALRFGAKGIYTLRNGGVLVPVGNTQVAVAGIDDLRWGAPDLPRALKITQDNAAEVKVLLSHRPEIFPAAARKGVDLTLAGHYHGGQVKLGDDSDSLSIARLITPYPEGLFRLPRSRRGGGVNARESSLFVSRGIGITGLPIRINCPPQIAHLTLRRA